MTSPDAHTADRESSAAYEAVRNPQELRALLGACAEGRLTYAREITNATLRARLEGEATGLRAALAILAGDWEIAYGLVPSWQWAEAGLPPPSCCRGSSRKSVIGAHMERESR
jgi:hypothetical protein